MMTLPNLVSHPEGFLLEVKAQPGSKRDEIRGIRDGVLKVCVTQVPEKGKANKSIRKQLAKSLELRASQVELVSGETASRKTFLLRDVDEKKLRATLDRLEHDHD